MNHRTTLTRGLLCGALLLSTAGGNFAADPGTGPRNVKYRVTGLFGVERAEDLRDVVQLLPHIDLVQVDVQTGIAEFRFDERLAFGQGTPQQIIERFDTQVRGASRSTFGIRPLSALPVDQWTKVEIPVAGLDCQACCLAAYEAIAKIEGVEHALASFRLGKVTAWIDGTKTNREALEGELRKKHVDVSPRPDAR